MAASLLTLPPELILEIGDHLPPDGVLALKLAHPGLNAHLPLAPHFKSTTLSPCARLAIRTYLAPLEPAPTHMRCILCKATYPAYMFSSSSSPACVPASPVSHGFRPEVIELPRRFCAWHVGRLARIVHTEQGGMNEWVSKKRDMCMHCGVVRGWGACDCQCGSCGVRTVRTYTRYLNNNTECRRFLFWRQGVTKGDPALKNVDDGQLFVKEICWDPNATGPAPIINFPMYYENEADNETSDDAFVPG